MYAPYGARACLQLREAEMRTRAQQRIVAGLREALKLPARLAGAMIDR